MDTFKKAVVAFSSTGTGLAEPLDAMLIGADFDDEDEYREALHDLIDDELDCLIERLEEEG